MNSLRRQQGMSILGVAFLLFLVVFFGLLFIKLSGSYYDHFTLTKMIENGVSERSTTAFNKSDFDDRLKKNMEINSIQLNLKEALKHDKRSNPPILVLDYENRVHLFGNVDVVMSFHEEYEL